MDSDIGIVFYILYILAGLVVSIVFGGICRAISSNRGTDGGFWWGFFLWIIGIIVVAVRPNDWEAKHGYSQIPYTDIEKLAALKDNGMITEEEFSNIKADSQSYTDDRLWKCECGSINKMLFPICLSCGRRRETGDEPARNKEKLLGFPVEKKNNPDNIPVNTSSPINEIREYKALLDDGIITKEEYETKKKQLLGL